MNSELEKMIDDFNQKITKMTDEIQEKIYAICASMSADIKYMKEVLK